MVLTFIAKKKKDEENNSLWKDGNVGMANKDAKTKPNHGNNPTNKLAQGQLGRLDHGPQEAINGSR